MKLNEVATSSRIVKIAQIREITSKTVSSTSKESAKQINQQSVSTAADRDTQQVLRKVRTDTAPIRSVAAVGIVATAHHFAMKNYEKYMGKAYVNENKQLILKTDMGMKAVPLKSEEGQKILASSELRGNLVTNSEAIQNTLRNQGISSKLENLELGENSLVKELDLADYGGISKVVTKNANNEASHVVMLSKAYKASYGNINNLLSKYETKELIKRTVEEALKNNTPLEEVLKNFGSPDGYEDPLNPKIDPDALPKNRLITKMSEMKKKLIHVKKGSGADTVTQKTLLEKAMRKSRETTIFKKKQTDPLREKYTNALMEKQLTKVQPTKRDKKLVKAMGSKAKRLDHMSKFTRKTRLFKKSGKGVFRIATSSLNQSEAMQGFRILQGAQMPAKMASKLGGKMTGRVAFRGIKMFKIHRKAKKIRLNGANISKKAARDIARKEIEKSFGKHYTNNFFSNRIKSAVKNKVMDAAINVTAGKENILLQSINAQIRATKDLGPDGVRTARKARRTIRKDFRNKAKLAKSKNVIKTKKTAEKGSRKLLDIGQKVFKSLQRAVKKVVDFIRHIASVIASFSSIFVPATVVIGLLLMFIFVWYMFMGDYAAELSSAVWFNGETPQTSSFNDTMSELQAKHSEMVEKIQAEQESYEVADVQYTNGTQENYKEILAATQVIFNNEPYNFSQDEVNEVVDRLYDQTHKMTTETYSFQENDGSGKTAAHVFVNIKRNEELCYSVLDGVMSSGGSTTITSNYCPAGSVSNEDWMNIVKTVKTLIAETGTEYSQTTTVPISVNGTTHNVRPDCSGYVSICLELFGSFPSDQKWSSTQFVSAGSISGFTKYAWSGWENLQEGDIIAKNGHVEIFGYNSGGKHYVYSNGSTPGVRTPGVTTDNDSYMVVWRPNSAGSTGESGGSSDSSSGAGEMAVTAQEEYLLACIIDCEAGGEPYQGQLAVGSVILNRVASLSFPNSITDVVYQSGQFAPVSNGALDKKLTSGPSNSCVNAAREVLSGTRVVNNLYFQTNALAASKGITGTVIGNHTFHGATVDVTLSAGSSGGSGISDPYKMIKFSNMPNVDFDKVDNQSGYETALKATVDAFSSSSMFTADTFDPSNTVHYTTDDLQSSLDFVRTIYAHHGVDIADSMQGLHDQFDIGSYSKLAVGDIILYRANDAWTVNAIDKAYNKASDDSGRNAALAHYADYVPMIYIGDNKAVAFSKNLSNTDSDYTYSTPAVRTYTIGTDISKKRVAEIRHVTKIVNTGIYGSTDFFCGWTDDMIAQMITILNEPYWISKKVTYIGPEGEEISIDFFSSYVEDYFDGDVAGNSVFSTTTHDQTFLNDISRIALLSYENYTILPSVLTADAVLKSNNRTTEESLKYFNIYEKIASAGGASVDKYSYDSSGNPTVYGVSYVIYSSLTEALNDHCEDMNGKYSLSSATDYSTLTSILSGAGYCTSDYASQMNSFIIANGLTNLDTIALIRKAYMDDATAKYNDLTDIMSKYTGSTTSSGYLKIKDAVKALEDSQKTMDDYIASTDTSTSKSQLLDANIGGLLGNAKAEMENQIANQVKSVTDECGNLKTLVSSLSGKSGLSTDECKKLINEVSIATHKRSALETYMSEIGESRDTASTAVSDINSAINDADALLKKQADVESALLSDKIDYVKDTIDTHGGKKSPKKSDYDALKKAADDAVATANEVDNFMKYSGLMDSGIYSGIDNLRAWASEAYKEAKAAETKRLSKITIASITCNGHEYTDSIILYHSEEYPDGKLYSKKTKKYNNYLGTDYTKVGKCTNYKVEYTSGWADE